MFQHSEVVDLKRIGWDKNEEVKKLLEEFPKIVENIEKCKNKRLDCYRCRYRHSSLYEDVCSCETDMWDLTNSLVDKIDVCYESIGMKFKEKMKRCSCCSNHYPPKLNTIVDGTYKYTHGKFNSFDYDLCPMCMYLATRCDSYGRLCSSICTYDKYGIIRYRPNEDTTRSWCFVHPELFDQEYVKDEKDEYIDSRYCMNNN